MKLFLIAALFLTALVVVPCLAEEEQEATENVADIQEASEVNNDEATEGDEEKNDEEETNEDTNEKIPDEFQDEVEQVKRGVTQLSVYSCNVLKRYGYCRQAHIARFCVRVCKPCHDQLSVQSCRKVKYTMRKCRHNIGLLYCRRTCGHCRQSCNAPLGMQSRAIPNARITASSMWDRNHAPFQGRLHYRSGHGKAGSWSSKINRAGQWIQVDLGKITLVTGIATQGRYDHNQWVTSYYLQYSNNGRNFVNYLPRGKWFVGNRNRHTVVRHALRPIRARYIRVVARTWYGHISLRMELYGCKH